MEVFDYCIYFVPPKKDSGDAQIVKSGQVLAKDADTAKLRAVRECPEDWSDKLGDGLEVAVRPFRG